MQKSFMLLVEQDKVIDAYVTHWQELEKQGIVQQGQSLKSKALFSKDRNKTCRTAIFLIKLKLLEQMITIISTNLKYHN